MKQILAGTLVGLLSGSFFGVSLSVAINHFFLILTREWVPVFGTKPCITYEIVALM